MGYSNSHITVERRYEDLKPLLAMKSYRWNVSNRGAGKFARQIREALAIVRRYPDEFEEALVQAAQYFKIELIDDWTVQAVPKERVTVTQAPPPEESLRDEGEAPGGGGHAFGKPVARVGLQNAEQVVDAWLKHLPSNDPINFPQTVLPLEEMVKLYTWARRRTPRLMIFAPEGSLTVAIAEDGVEEHSWHPPTAQQVVEKFNI